MTTHTTAPIVIHLTVAGRGKLAVELSTEITGRREDKFPVPLATQPLPGGLAEAEVLYAQGATVGEPDQKWHVKIYRCHTPEPAAALAQQFAVQSRLVLAANRLLPGAGHPLHPPWAMVPFFVVRADGTAGAEDSAFRTRFDSGTDEVSAYGPARLPELFGPHAPPQPESCLVVISPLLDAPPADWWADELYGPVRAEAMVEFDQVAIGLDTFAAAGLTHCDVKARNLGHLPYPPYAGYLLIDGDAVTPHRVASTLAGLRATHLPPSVRRKLDLDGRTRVEDGEKLTALDLKETDRYAFVVTVLTALTSEPFARHVVATSEPGQARQDLLARFGPSHAHQARHIADALEPSVLRGESWSATEWLAALRTPPTALLPPPSPHLVARYGRNIQAVHDVTCRVAVDRVAQTLYVQMRSQATEIQRRAWRRTALVGSAAVMVVGLLVLLVMLTGGPV